VLSLIRWFVVQDFWKEDKILSYVNLKTKHEHVINAHSCFIGQYKLTVAV